jgi:hypothetical protein
VTAALRFTQLEISGDNSPPKFNYALVTFDMGESAVTKKCALTNEGNRATPAPPTIEFMQDGSCDGYFPGRRIAFSIPEHLVTAVRKVLEGRESCTREVSLFPAEEYGDDVCCALRIKDLCLFMSEMELQEFAHAFISSGFRNLILRMQSTTYK